MSVSETTSRFFELGGNVAFANMVNSEIQHKDTNRYIVIILILI